MKSDNIIMPNGLDLTSMLKMMNCKIDEVDTFTSLSYARFQATYTISEAQTDYVKPFAPPIFSSRGDIPYDPETGLFAAAPGQMYIFLSQFVLNSSRTTWSRIRHFLTQTNDDGETFDDILSSVRTLNINPPINGSGEVVSPDLPSTRIAFQPSLQIISYNSHNMEASNGTRKFGQAYRFESGAALPVELSYYGLLLHFNTWES